MATKERAAISLRAGIALSLVASCTSQPQELGLSRIIIDAPAQFDRANHSRRDLRAALRQRLEQDPGVAGFVRRPEASHRLRLLIHPVVKPEAEPAYRPIEVVLTSLGKAPSFSAAAKTPPADDVTGSVLTGFNQAWALLTRLRTLQVQKDGELIAAVHDPDIQVRLFAIERLGERRSPEAVPNLVGLLTSEERPEVMLRAVGALVAIGDEKAVAPLIDLTYRKDPAFVLQIVFAVSAIGGRTAEGFLVTLASGHPHPEIQRGAKDALEEMRRKRTRGG